MRRKLIAITVVTLLLAAGGFTLAQRLPSRASVEPEPSASDTKLEDMTIDQLLEEVEKIRLQRVGLEDKSRLEKAELEKKERATYWAIKMKSAAQQQRMVKLGVAK